MLSNESNIDVTRLKPGMKLFLETGTAVYTLLVLRPKLGLVQVTSSRPELRQPTVGQLIGSYQSDASRTAFLNQIVKNFSFCLRFADGYFTSTPVTAAEVSGGHWHYIVF